jgi:phosphohistidine swiveling domain-containing protein
MQLVHTLNAGMSALREYFGSSLWTSVIVFEGNQGKWLFRPKELMLLGQKMIDFLMCPPYRVAFLTGYEISKRRLLAKTEEVKSLNLESASSQDLAFTFEQYSRYYCDWYKYGWFCEPIQFQAQDLLLGYIDHDLKGATSTIDPKQAVQALFTVDTESFSVGILRHLATCASALAAVLRNNTTRSKLEALRGRPDFPTRAAAVVFDEDASHADVLQFGALLEEHSSLYSWKRNNYFESVIVTPRDVLLEILSDDKFDLNSPAAGLQRELATVEASRVQLLSQKNEVIHLLPTYYKNIANLGTLVGGALLDDRKKHIMIANGVLDTIVAEAARRTGVTLADCHYLIPQEFAAFLTSPAEYRDRIAARKEAFVVFQGDFAILDEMVGSVAVRSETQDLHFASFTMPDPFMAEGQSAQKLLAQLDSRLNLFSSCDSSAVAENLQGVTAYCDPDEMVVEGRVRLILNPKTEEAERGEILVAPSTTPDYIASIRKCKAIVTDWGGQTSHAATVARELKKPCIVATNYASQILHTGDFVRLDLASGVVAVVKR